MKDFKFDKLPLFGAGANRDELFWHTIFRQAVLHDYLYKEIEQYGILKLTDQGKKFIKHPESVMIPLNRDFTVKDDGDIDLGGSQGAALDNVLVELLKDLRKSEARKLKLMPWVIFSEPSLQDMATYYPISMDDMLKIAGVSQGKADKFAKPFIELIKKYVEENEIERPLDMVVKSIVNKSGLKVYIIQSIDRKLPLEDIASAKGLSLNDLIAEIESIVSSGTKVNITYYLNEIMEDDKVYWRKSSRHQLANIKKEGQE